MTELIYWAIFGSVLSEVLLLRKRLKTPKSRRPKYSVLEVIGLVVINLFLGIGLVCLYHSTGTALNPVLAVNIAASAPIIVQTLVSSPPSEINP